jgi:hypothetical protein
VCHQRSHFLLTLGPGSRFREEEEEEEKEQTEEEEEEEEEETEEVQRAWQCRDCQRGLRYICS